MKTSHQFARELLTGPDLPICHFDPSRAGMDDEDDTSLSDPTIERVTLDAKEIAAGKDRAEELGRELLTDFLTINGDGDVSDEPGDFAEKTLDLLVAGGHVSKEKLEEAREILRGTMS